MATLSQNKEFSKNTFGEYPLDLVIDWIKRNMDIEDVFDKSDLLNHVASNYKPIEVFNESDILDYASEKGWVDISEYRENKINQIIK